MAAFRVFAVSLMLFPAMALAGDWPQFRGPDGAGLRDLALAGRLAERVRQYDDLQLMAEPSLRIVCFRFAPPPI